MIKRAFSHFCQGFRADDAADWVATFHWVVDGAGSWTVAFDHGTCAVREGLSGAPTCTITTSAATLASIFSGELDSTAAFMSGAAVADNLHELMQLAAVLDFDAIREAVGGKAAAPIQQGTWETVGSFPITQGAVHAYTRATSDPNPAYYGATALAPPMFHVRFLVDAFFAMAGRLRIDLSRFYHAGHSADFHRSMRVGDTVEVRVKLDEIVQKDTGKLYHFAFEERVGEHLTVSGRSSFFLKERGEVGASRPTPNREDPDYISMQMVDSDQAERYAAASGDHNPLHLNPAAAIAAGLNGVILHGLCTLAFAQRDLIDETMTRDPRRMAHLSARFAAPVYPGQTLKLHFWYEAGKELSFETRSWDDTQRVLQDGLVRLH
ncbi:MAG: MaoC family dehydratase N-terminal domain-containing protein [Deltaproteobacteria bacterium]|nr:MaoC family dehydratase N-terminal domain-containing protein [Deltaproteobacteria bacterium]